MAETKNKEYMKMLPFTDDATNRFLCYDNAEYFANRDRINNQIKKESGNIMKYYQAGLKKQHIKIGGDAGVAEIEELEELEENVSDLIPDDDEESDEEDDLGLEE